MLPLPGQPEKILVLWICRMGDFLISTPFLKSLRARFPEARITLLTSSKAMEAALLCRDVDERIEIPSFPHGIRCAILAARLLRERFDVAVDLNASFSRVAWALMRMCHAHLSLAFQKKGYKSPPLHLIAASPPKEHILDRFGRLAEAIGAEYGPQIRLNLPPDTAVEAERILKPYPLDPEKIWICIHPGNFKKFNSRWPEEKIAELARRLLKRGDTEILWMTGPGEQKPTERVASQTGRPAFILPPLPLGLMGAVLKRMNLWIGNGTGTWHLAVAVGTPTFTVLTGYAYTVWRQREGRHCAVPSDAWETCRHVPVDAVFKELTQFLSSPLP